MKNKKEYLSHSDMDRYYRLIIQQMHKQKYVPDVVIGIARGGLDMSTKLSHYFDCPHEMISWQTRDGKVTNHEKNILSEILTKYNNSEERILFADDICDSGTTLIGIEQEARELGMYVNYACAIENESALYIVDMQVNFAGRVINRLDEPQWFVFPWESWFEG